MVDWSIQLSELVVDEDKYPESEGRGPFWELLRYGLRGMTFGPVVCKKLANDFEKWYMDAWALGDLEFYQGARKAPAFQAGDAERIKLQR